jgi:four helix bundle protein
LLYEDLLTIRWILGRAKLDFIGNSRRRFRDSEIRGAGEMGSSETTRAFDLEDRLVDLAASTCRIATDLPSGGMAAHISGQLIRCGTAPAANYAEARTSESRRDFVHKMKVCLKELRETHVWLKLLRALGLADQAAVGEAIAETDELIAIFVTSIATARRNDKRSGG